MLTAVRGAVCRASMPHAVLDALHQTNRSCASSPASTTFGKYVFNMELLASLVCPLSKGELRYDADKQELVSQEISVAYPVVAGIPRLMPTAGRLIDKASSSTNQ